MEERRRLFPRRSFGSRQNMLLLSRHMQKAQPRRNPGDDVSGLQPREKLGKQILDWQPKSTCRQNFCACDCTVQRHLQPHDFCRGKRGLNSTHSTQLERAGRLILGAHIAVPPPRRGVVGDRSRVAFLGQHPCPSQHITRPITLWKSCRKAALKTRPLAFDKFERWGCWQEAWGEADSGSC
jgi:hypothetical protein